MANFLDVKAVNYYFTRVAWRKICLLKFLARFAYKGYKIKQKQNPFNR